MDVPDKGNLLRSWKEISVHLGVDERTCARWEQKLGMPVHRAEEGMARSRVFAYKDELDRWFQETFSSANGNGKPEILGNKRRARRHVLIPGLAVVLVAVSAAAFLGIKAIVAGRASARQPADFHIYGTQLAIVNEGGRELWRRDTNVEGLHNEDYYRTYFQTADNSKTDDRLPSLVIRDINSDGRKETLFAIQKRNDSYGEGALICFDSVGTRLWTYSTGRELSFGGKVYSGDYRIHGFTTHDLNGDGREEIIIIAYQFPEWPCQLSVLNDRGQLIGEYWNSGQLKDVCFADLDGDGRPEMVVVGINNEHGACLIVFDPSRVSGCSPQTGKYRSDDLAAGSELDYVVAPKTDVSIALMDPVECFMQVGITQNSHVMTYTQHSLGYEFDFGLRCVNVDAGHGYTLPRDELLAMGKVHGPVDNSYTRSLIEALRYWDGEKFVSKPTPNLKNVRPAK